MSIIKKLNLTKTKIELAISSVLFIIAISYDIILLTIIYMLYFIIFLEIVRTLMHYINEQKIMLKLLIDASIILTLRELIVNVVKINNENIDSFEKLFASTINYNLIVISGVIIFLYFVRYLSIKIRTDNINK